MNTNAIHEPDNIELPTQVDPPIATPSRNLDERVTEVTPNDMLYKYQPCGSTIFINGGVVGGPSPLFGWRVTPRMPSWTRATVGGLQQWSPVTLLTTDDGSQLPYEPEAYLHPFTVFQEPQLSSFIGSTVAHASPVKGVGCLQYGQEPLFSRYSKLFRGWSGTIHYRFRAIANFTTQGYIRVVLVNGRPILKTPTSEVPNSLMPANAIVFNDLQDYTTLGWLTLDMSSKRHTEITVPYQRQCDWYDEFTFTNTYPADSTTLAAFPDTEQYIMFMLSGVLTTQNSAQIQIEVEYRPGEDFSWIMPIYPYITVEDRCLHNLAFYKNRSETSKTLGQYCPWHDPNFVSFVIGDHDVIPANWVLARIGTSLAAADIQLPFADCRTTRVLLEDTVMSQVTDIVTTTK